jgi:hypothetical protein
VSRKSLERRRVADERWPQLTNLMACYFNQDFDILYGSLQGAIDAATSEGAFEHRRTLLKEWRDWNVTEGVVDEVRPFLYQGFWIDVVFVSAIDARTFMNQIYDGLLLSVKAGTGGAGRQHS